jgi:hypothetical protein
MWSNFAVLCDEYHVSSRLNLKLEIDPSRESLLHFFEQIRKAFPEMNRFRRREDGSLVLDSEEEMGRQSLRVDAGMVKVGCTNPPDADSFRRLVTTVFELAPVHLSLSDLNYDSIEVEFGFDLEYRGNHDELVAETLFAEHPLSAVLSVEGGRVIDCQPCFGMAISEDCATQAYLELKSRTSTYEVRANEYDEAPLSVNLLVRRYWEPSAGGELLSLHSEVFDIAQQLALVRIVPHIVQPLAAAIASRR